MTDRRPTLPSIIAAAMLVVATGATAQPAAIRDSTHRTCWTPLRPPLCRTIVVTEALVEKRFDEPRAPARGIEKGLGLTLGALRGLGAGNAMGLTGTLGLIPENDVTPHRIELRYRHWTGRQGGVDLSAGVVHTLWRDYLGEARPVDGGSAAVGWSNGLLGIDARVDLLRPGNRRQASRVSLGVRAGARAFPFAGGLALVLGSIAGMMGGDT